MENRRKEKRFEEENRVVIHSARNTEGATQHMEINASTHNLSLGGARITSHKVFPVGTVLRIQIHLERSKQAVKLDGRVIWVNKIQEKDLYEFGVEFLHHISKTVLSLIRHLYGENTDMPTSVS